MLEPQQFAVNESWVAFRINEDPIELAEGTFNVVGLMDVGSTFIFGQVMLPASAQDFNEAQAGELLKFGLQKSKGKLPKSLFIPNECTWPKLASEAKRIGITAISIPQIELLAITDAACESFRSFFRAKL